MRRDKMGCAAWWVIGLWWMGMAFDQPAGAAAPSKKGVADDLFTNTVVRRLQIEIPPEGIATLRQYRWRPPGHPEERAPVPATLREGGSVYTNVAVHLKGAAGSFRPLDSKPGFTLKFDKWAGGQLFHGLSKISLNNSVQDPAYITDKLCRELFEQAGVPVPQADYATVELNGRRLGLYVLTEGWDKKFLKRYFKNVKGNLYDPPPGYDINKPFLAVSGEHPEDQSDLRTLCRVATNSPLAERIVELRKVVDWDRFLTMMALDAMLWNWDGYPLNKNNYRVFHDLDSQRLVFMPHGMDQMFWNTDGPIVTGRNGLVARAVMQTAEGRRLYLDRFRQLRANLFHLQTITNRVNELAARIGPAVVQGGLFAGVQHEQAVSLLRERIAQRAQNIDEQLEGVKHLLKINTNEVASLSGWKPRIVSGEPVFDLDREPKALQIRAQKPSGAAWWTVVWLEEGSYTIEGRIKTRGVVADSNQPLRGAGLRVLSTRKRSDGVHWSWFPYAQSNDYWRRGEVSTNRFSPRLVGSRDWTTVTSEVDLRQPIADLEVLCELYAEAGEAWFDLKSLTITRRTDICP